MIIGLSFRDWANDHFGKLPMEVSRSDGGSKEWVNTHQLFQHYVVISNYLSTGDIIFCPAETGDSITRAGLLRNGFSNNNVSYFLNLQAHVKSNTILAGDRNLIILNRTERPNVVVSNIEELSWSKELHNLKGNILMSSGEVRFFPSKELSNITRNITYPIKIQYPY